MTHVQRVRGLNPGHSASECSHCNWQPKKWNRGSENEAGRKGKGG